MIMASEYIPLTDIKIKPPLLVYVAKKCTQKTPLLVRGTKNSPYTSLFYEIVLEIKTADNHAPFVNVCCAVCYHLVIHDCPPFLKFISES